MKAQPLVQAIAFTLIGACIAYWLSSAPALEDKILETLGGATGGFLVYVAYRIVTDKLNPPA